MKHWALKLFLTMILLAAVSLPCYPQAGTSSSITGVVVDQSGAVIPGANVAVKNEATGAEAKATTADNGTFMIPGLAAGSYTATVSMPSFKTAVMTQIVVVLGAPTNVKITLQVGGSTETVSVVAGAEVIQSTSATVSSTLSTTQMSQLPLATRNSLDFLVFLPGANTTGSSRNATFMGMPNSTVHITVDGVPTQDLNYMGQYGGDGFYSFITPRPDSMQEVTVTTAAAGADATGAGAVQIRFVTRSGDNDYHGSLYDYERNTAFNSNYWFTNRDAAKTYWGDGPNHGQPCTAQQLATEFDNCRAARSRFILHQAGGRIGGPISIPGLFSGKDKAFFFLNLESFRLPNSLVRTNSIYSPAMEQGIFSYVVSGQVKTVDMLALAQANGQTAAIDPTVKKLITDVRNSTTTIGALQSYPTVSDPNYQYFIWQSKGLETRSYMTSRFDFNLTTKQRVELSWNGETRTRNPDYLNGRGWVYPGFPSYGRVDQHRGSISYALRSTITPRLVNEVRGGILLGTVLFNPNASPGDFVGGPQGIGNLGGFYWSFSTQGFQNPIAVTTPSRRNGPEKNIDDTLTWTKGSHNLSFGGSFMHIGSWEWWQTLAPTLTIGMNSTYDPAYAMFNSTNGPKNFPGASSTLYGNASALYANLTGRVTAISANAVINENTNQYTYNGPYTERARQREMGIFAQDSWRMFPNFTLTYGLRWEVQFPWTPLNNAFSWASPEDIWGPTGVGNFFKPGSTGGVPTLLHQFQPGTHAYNVDWRSFAPSVGFAWSPKATGLLGKFLGESSQTVIRSGFAIAYNRMGMFDYEDYLFGANPGGTIDASRNVTNGNLLNAGQTWPLLLTPNLKSGLGAPTFASSPTWPLAPNPSSSINTIEQHIRTPYTMSWTFGIQREITKDMAVEVRYAATRNLQVYTQPSINEYNVVQNGFLNEFRLAQKNLTANVLAGKGNSFAYTGVAGTSPLPITLAYIAGKVDPNNPANYTSTLFTNSTYVNSYLSTFSPNPASLASSLFSDATRRANGLAAGLPANEFIVNPDVVGGGAWIYMNGGGNYYDSMVVELRRRLSKGLLVQGNYTWAKGLSLTRLSWRAPAWVKDVGSTLPETLKINWVYELPFGHGRTLFSGIGHHLDNVIGGWEFQGTSRIQSGNLWDFGNVTLVGMTPQDLKNAVGLRFDDANRIVYYLPQDIIDNSYKAYNYGVNSSGVSGYTLGVPTGRYIAPAGMSAGGNCVQIIAGDCAPRHYYIRGPMFTRFDLSIVKRIRFTETKNFELRGEFLNAFNNIDFNGYASLTGSSTSFARITSAYSDSSNQQDPGGRLIQIVMRINF
jgi:hypothetical protein